mgnify:CR=1 FL=1
MITLLLFLGGILSLALYFAPSIVAVLRKRSNLLAIVFMNTFLGWSIFGWVLSMVWALSNDAPTTIVIHNHTKD